jgi:hypothetical protein
MRVPIAIAIAILLSAPLFAGFEPRSLEVSILLNPDGGAHVSETVSFVTTTQESRDLYESTFKYNQLSDWKERLGIEDIRHHISRAQAEFAGLRIKPHSVEKCNQFTSQCQAALSFDYDVSSSANVTGLLVTDNYKPRTTQYSINANALSFDTSKSGDILIDRSAKLILTIPKDAEKIRFSEKPNNLPTDTTGQFEAKDNTEYYIGPERTFYWQDRTLPKFEFSYEIEQTLESEVVQFFKKSQESISQSVFSSEGLASLLIIAVVLASAIYLNRVKKPS